MYYDFRAFHRRQFFFVFKHKHSKFVKQFIIDGVKNITTAFTAVRSAENVIYKFKFVFKFKVDTILFGYRFLNGTKFRFCDFYAEFSVFDEVERNDIAVTDTTENFGTSDFVVEIVFNDFYKLSSATSSLEPFDDTSDAPRLDVKIITLSLK